jgi:hypothetical protein
MKKYVEMIWGGMTIMLVILICLLVGWCGYASGRLADEGGKSFEEKGGVVLYKFFQ